MKRFYSKCCNAPTELLGIGVFCKQCQTELNGTDYHLKEETEQCSIAGVSGSVCFLCKGENWIDEGILTKPCPACGGKQTDR